MKILHAVSEVYPFSKTGGLADVAYALPVSQSRLGHEVYVVSPLYKGILEKFPKIRYTGKKTWVDTDLGTFEFGIYRLNIKNVKFIFLSNIFLFERGGYYGEKGKDFPDNFLIFGCFVKAVLNVVRHLLKDIDIVHCHDWQAALIPSLLKTEYKDLHAKSVFTIHNLAFQGLFDLRDILKLRIDRWLCGLECLEFYSLGNFVKSAISTADFVTTVSPSYAEEIKTEELGFGLEGVLKKHSGKLVGIINGIDYKLWNPNADNFIFKKYSRRTLKNKMLNKMRICEDYGLDKRLPLFGFVSRFTEQKGISILMEMLELFHSKANFILLGDGDLRIKNELGRFKNFAGVRTIFGYNEALSRQIYAGSDFYLMPSRFEPCGISQLIAMRYGCIPVVRGVGGLKDTVRDISYDDGYGIIFDDYTSEEFMIGIERALKIYHSGDFVDIAKKNMLKDFSWVNSAVTYVNLYEKILK